MNNPLCLVSVIQVTEVVDWWQRRSCRIEVLVQVCDDWSLLSLNIWKKPKSSPLYVSFAIWGYLVNLCLKYLCQSQCVNGVHDLCLYLTGKAVLDVAGESMMVLGCLEYIHCGIPLHFQCPWNKSSSQHESIQLSSYRISSTCECWHLAIAVVSKWP